jgi:hypothetical protein
MDPGEHGRRGQRSKGAAVPPYRFGRHPLTVELDEYVSDPERAATLLREIRSGSESTEFASQLQASHQLHLFEEVYGRAPLTGEPEEDDETEHGRRRRLLYRDGIRAALELALGIGRDEDVPDPPTRVDPIDTFWGCGQPFDQAWVGWSSRDEMRHIVLVLFSDTPAMGWDDELLLPVDRSFPPTEVEDKGLVVMYRGGDGKTSISEVAQPGSGSTVS